MVKVVGQFPQITAGHGNLQTGPQGVFRRDLGGIRLQLHGLQLHIGAAQAGENPQKALSGAQIQSQPAFFRLGEVGQQHGVLPKGEKPVVLQQHHTRANIQLFDHAITAFSNQYTTFGRVCHRFSGVASFVLLCYHVVGKPPKS